MKVYPAIPRDFREFDAHLFDKIDGSNLRFEWTHKQGWRRFGTRHRLFDQTDEVFGSAIEIFQERLAKPVTETFQSHRFEKAVLFTEFWGINSFAGVHDPLDAKNLTIIDLAVHKQGLVPPREFLKLFRDLPDTDVAHYLGKFRWTRGLVERIRHPESSPNGTIGGITFEGVVGKGAQGRKLIMRKAKTQAWIDRVKERFSEEAAKKILAS